jgi:hypothetical protein
MVAQRFSLLKEMCLGSQPWVEIIYYFVEKVGIQHGKTKTIILW